MNRGRFGTLFFVFLILAALQIVSFQNCSRISFSVLGLPGTSEKSDASMASDGGEVYDGKIIVLHNYEDGFQCEGRTQPKGVLIHAAASGWVHIENTRSKCAATDQVAVTGVVYDPVLNEARYQNKTYVPPRPYLVDASEIPNLPDTKLIDGICEDINGRCSLLAAVQTAGFVSPTAPTSVLVPAGSYRLTSPIVLTTSRQSTTITITGADTATTVLDGQSLTSLFAIGGFDGVVNLNHLRFQNGSSNTGGASGVTASSFQGALEVDDCLFSGNQRDAPIYALGAQNILIRRSVFRGNSATFANVYMFGVQRFAMIDTSISQNTGYGVISMANQNVSLKSSVINGNQGVGIFSVDCKNCEFENLTIFRNLFGGINILAQFPGAEYDLGIKNSTIYENSVYAMQVAFQSAANQLVLSNSVVAQNTATAVNCRAPGPTFSSRLLATNSVFDDGTCTSMATFSGAGNRVLSPMLGALANNGGVTESLLPLPGSPLIDSGDGASCTATDQRGFSRPVDKLGGGALCDIGATELQ